MDRHAFENRLKILRSIDYAELREAGVFRGEHHAEKLWARFRGAPADYLLTADDETAIKIWTVVEGRAGDDDFAVGWQEMASAPRDGSGFLAYGVHAQDDPPGAARGVRRGDHWWAIILWDIWRSSADNPDQPMGWVFAKDGAKVWSEPKRWRRLTVPWPFDEPLIEYGGHEDGPGEGLLP